METVSAVKVGDSAQLTLDKIFAFVPNLIGALIVLIIGYVVARVIRTAVTKALQHANMDNAVKSGHAGSYIDKMSPGLKPSKLVGVIAFWLVFLGAISLAVSVLEVEALTAFVASIYSYMPNVIAAVLIFVVAGLVATAAGTVAARTMGDTPTGKIVGTAVPVVVMAIGGFMILDQLQIAPQIVTITYAAILGSAALGLALAFGLGARETAAKMVAEAYEKGRQHSDQVRQDFQIGKQRAAEQADDARTRIEHRLEQRDATSEYDLTSHARHAADPNP